MKKVDKVVLHIGYEKTGTTSIQRVFSDNRTELLAQGVLYPRLPGEVNHTLFAVYFSDGKLTEDLWSVEPNKFKNYDVFRSVFEDSLRSEIEQSDARVVVISNEHLSSRLRDTESVGRIADFLKTITDTVEIVFYVREQIGLIPSLYSTSVKSGNVESFESFVERFHKKYDFNEILSPWLEVFGAACIKTRLFDRSHLFGGDVVEDFCSVIGVEYTALSVRFTEQNVSLSKVGVDLLRKMNVHVPRALDGKANPKRGNLVALIEMFDTTDPHYKLRLLPAMQHAVAEFYREPNERFAKAYSVALACKESGVDTTSDTPTIIVDERLVELFSQIYVKKQEQVIALQRKLNRQEGTRRT